MSSTHGPGTIWITSSYSDGQGGNCLQWAPVYATSTGVVPVRDSKVPEGPGLRVSAGAWAAFVGGVKGAGSAAL
ncbi:DUF397 domain-containing protein [Streptomyces sp. NPDC048111]|uniref:DUF397 domain-containing protein n=1 Tax=Streptomyces sp. NPDC048111 TaxID=3365500 RepID=UPI0037186069